MTQTKLRKIKQDALIEVNKIRKRYGKRPIKAFSRGAKNSRNSCPVANALHRVHKNIQVNKHYYEIPVHRTLPKKLKKFIDLFDKGTFPSLVK